MSQQDAPESRPADALYQRAEQLRAQQNLLEAVQVLEELIALQPDYPNALNLAGWLLAFEAGSLERGIELLQRAVKQFPDASSPVANLVEALLKAERPAEALAVAEAAVARSPYSAEALNTLGWLKTQKLGRLDEGIADLERATRLSTWHANANFNLGHALLQKGDREAAFEAFRSSTVHGSWRNHEGHFRVGEGHEKAGRLRRALGSYRQATRLDGRGELSAELNQAINRVGITLLQRGQFFLHAEDEQRFFQYLRRHQGIERLERIKVHQVLAEARRVQAGKPSPGLELMIANLAAGTLLPGGSDRSPHELLIGDPSLKPLLDRYFAFWARVYALLLEAEEPERQEPGAAVLRLIQAHKFAEAAALLKLWNRASEEGIVGCAQLAEQAGDVAWTHGELENALGLYALSQDAYAQYASGSSSGGEGLARMVDVERLRAKLKP